MPTMQQMLHRSKEALLHLRDAVAATCEVPSFSCRMRSRKCFDAPTVITREELLAFGKTLLHSFEKGNLMSDLLAEPYNPYSGNPAPLPPPEEAIRLHGYQTTPGVNGGYSVIVLTVHVRADIA